MRNRIIAVMMVVFVTGGFCLTGCGGGGGGGGTSNTSSSYKGSTTQATVTASNAKALSVDAVNDVQNATAIGIVGKNLSGVSATSPKVVAIKNTLENSIIKIQAKSAAKTVASTEQGTEYGYSGSFNYAGNFNESTGVFTGSISFNQYREMADTAFLSGSITFAGVFNQATDEFSSLNITVTDLQSLLGSEAFVLNGSMALTNAGYTQNLSLSLVLLDVASNRTYWFKDFTLALDGDSMSMSGVYYDHLHGYVVISTVTPLTVSSYSGEPASGQLLFSGSNGTKARLTFTSSGYTLEVDENGNNAYIVVP